MTKIKRQLTKNLNGLVNRIYSQKLIALAIILLVTFLGFKLLTFSHALTPYLMSEAESGKVAYPAQVITEANTSGSSVVKFGSNTGSVAMDGSVALGLNISGTPFATNSFWNTPLPTNTSTNINNTDYQNIIEDNFCNLQTAVPDVSTTCPISTFSGGINVSQYSAPLYVVPSNQPLISVTPSCVGAGTHTPSSAFLASISGGVPIPSDAHAAGGTDEEVQIYQPSTDKYWEFWRFQKDSSGNWDACWGGEITSVSQSTGIFANDLGATGTSIPLIGADARIDELQSGSINHVLGLIIGDASSGDLSSNVLPANTAGATSGVSWPATHGDGGSSNPLAIPEGTHFRLPATLNLNNYNLTPVGKEIAIAAQKYGFVVDDSSPQASLQIRLGDPIGYTTAGLANPYTSGTGVGGTGNNGLFAGVTQGAILNNFPWSQLQALPYNYGE